jgi:hypothetical protein
MLTPMNLGEVHFFMDNQEVARAYEKQCRKIFPISKLVEKLFGKRI